MVSVDHGEGPLSAGVSGKYPSSRAITLDGSWWAHPYWLVDAYLTLALDTVSETLDGMELSLVANNLLDRAYLATIAGQGALRWVRDARRLTQRDALLLTRRRPLPSGWASRIRNGVLSTMPRMSDDQR